MKIIFVIFMFLILNSSLQAYTKQIVLNTFKDRVGAETELKKFKNSKLYLQYNSLASGNSLKLLVCESADNVLLLVKPIKNRYILDATMDIVNSKYKKAYSEDLSSCKTFSKPVAKKVSPVGNTEVVPKVMQSVKKRDHSLGRQRKIIFSTYSSKNGALNELNTFRKDKIYKKLDLLATKNAFSIYIRPLGKYTILVAEPFFDYGAYLEALGLIKQKYKHAYGILDDSKRTTKKLVKSANLSKTILKVKKAIKTVKPNSKVEKIKEKIKVVKPVIEVKKAKKVKDEIKAVKAIKPILENEKMKDEIKTAKPILKDEKMKNEIKTARPILKNEKVEENKKAIKKVEITEVDETSSDNEWFSWYYVFLALLFVILFLLYRKYKLIYDEY